MRFDDYLAILGRRKAIVTLVVVAAVGVAVVGSYLITPVYSASTLVRLAQLQDDPATYYTINYTERVANTAVHLLTSRAFLERAAERVGLSIALEDLARAIRVETLANTELLRITAESSDPATAARLANTLATLLIESGQEAYGGAGQGAEAILRAQLDQAEAALREERASLVALSARTSDNTSITLQELSLRVRMREEAVAGLQAALTNATLRSAMLADSISVIDEALPPLQPIRPRPALNLAMGLILGVVGGTGLAFLADNLDRRILSANGLATVARLPVMGTVPWVSLPRGRRREAVLLDGDERAAAGEAFRAVRSVLMSGAMGAVPATLLVTSAEPRAGKSTLLANLAVALAHTGRSVIAVDSDLRRPGLHRAFGLPNGAGFSNAVLVPDSTRSLVRPTEIPGLRLLTAGTLLNSPAELLASPNLAAVLRDLAELADVVLYDSPPVLAATDAIVLAPLVDGVLLIASRGRATDRQIERALEQLRSVGATVLGTVLNRARPEVVYYGQYQSRGAPTVPPPARRRSDVGRGEPADGRGRA